MFILRFNRLFVDCQDQLVYIKAIRLGILPVLRARLVKVQVREHQDMSSYNLLRQPYVIKQLIFVLGAFPDLAV